MELTQPKQEMNGTSSENNLSHLAHTLQSDYLTPVGIKPPENVNKSPDPIYERISFTELTYEKLRFKGLEENKSALKTSTEIHEPISSNHGDAENERKKSGKKSYRCLIIAVVIVVFVIAFTATALAVFFATLRDSSNEGLEDDLPLSTVPSTHLGSQTTTEAPVSMKTSTESTTTLTASPIMTSPAPSTRPGCAEISSPDATYPNSEASPKRTTGNFENGVSICEGALFAHNKLRMLHSAMPPLMYSADLARRAEQAAVAQANDLDSNVASMIVGSFNMFTSDRIQAQFSSYGLHFSLADAIYAWYGAGSKCGYDYDTGETSEDQSTCSFVVFRTILWKQLTSVGCGMATRVASPQMLGERYKYITVVVCQYDPDLSGSNTDNIKPLTGAAIQSAYDLEPQGECIDKTSSVTCSRFSVCTIPDDTSETRTILMDFCKNTCFCSLT